MGEEESKMAIDEIGCEVVPRVEDLIENAKNGFQETFGVAATVCAVAPGRVNLIGEHTDYNAGFVFPMALPMVTVMVGRPTDDVTNDVTVVTNSQGADDPKKASFSCKKAELVPSAEARPKWANYVKGVVANFHADLEGKGFNAFVVNSVPLGGGLSSSASLEVATYTFLEELTGSRAGSQQEKALNCQKAEHQFAGMPCGIMDQFISVMGEEGCAVKIDCRSMEVDKVTMDSPEAAILIVNSNVKHELTGSEYPARRNACLEAAKLLGRASLRDLSLAEFEAEKSKLTSDEMRNRARHVVTEIDRCEAAAEALKAKDLVAFGKLMRQSHDSLKTDFEVSCPELDRLVELASGVEGVFGSRMTGGGFGGCTVTLLKVEVIPEVIRVINEGYEKKATFFVCKPSRGARGVKIV